MKITMLGVGNGFSPGVYDNNALLYDRGEYCMLDCGTTAWLSLEQLGIMRENISSIFLTHLHFDHSGGVESAALYGKYVTGKKPKLIVPDPIADVMWENVLKGTIGIKSLGLTKLEDYFRVERPKEREPFHLCGGLSAWWFSTKHIDGKFSCGVVINNYFLYTSDMICDPLLLESMQKMGIRVIFHDCQIKDAIVHADFNTLLGYPERLRKKIYLMHHGLKESSEAPDAGGMKFLFQHQEMDI